MKWHIINVIKKQDKNKLNRKHDHSSWGKTSRVGCDVIVIVPLSLYFLDDGCAYLSDGDQSFSRNIKYLEMKWYETPSVVKFAGGKFYARFSRTHGHDIFKPRQLRVEYSRFFFFKLTVPLRFVHQSTVWKGFFAFQLEKQRQCANVIEMKTIQSCWD